MLVLSGLLVVGIRSPWWPNASVRIHDARAGTAVALKLRPTTTPPRARRNRRRAHSPDRRLAEARLRSRLKFVAYSGAAVAVVLHAMSALRALSDPLTAQTAMHLYVAKSGNDANECLSINAPCVTIQGAIAKVPYEKRANVFISPGTYPERLRIIGDVHHRIEIYGPYDGERCIDPAQVVISAPGEFAIWAQDHATVIFGCLTIGPAQIGISAPPIHDSRFRQCEVRPRRHCRCSRNVGRKLRGRYMDHFWRIGFRGVEPQSSKFRVQSQYRSRFKFHLVLSSREAIDDRYHRSSLHGHD